MNFLCLFSIPLILLCAGITSNGPNPNINGLFIRYDNEIKKVERTFKQSTNSKDENLTVDIEGNNIYKKVVLSDKNPNTVFFTGKTSMNDVIPKDKQESSVLSQPENKSEEADKVFDQIYKKIKPSEVDSLVEEFQDSQFDCEDNCDKKQPEK